MSQQRKAKLTNVPWTREQHESAMGKKKVKPGRQVRAIKKATVRLSTIKCVYSTCVVVRGETTPSGKRYFFEPGEIQSVDMADVNYLLSLQKKGGRGCCGGGGSPVRNYFQEV